VNPFTGASMGRTLVGELPMKSKTTGNTQRRPVSGGGQASRVRDLQLRINELERSATSMYSQVSVARSLQTYKFVFSFFQEVHTCHYHLLVCILACYIDHYHHRGHFVLQLTSTFYFCLSHFTATCIFPCINF